VEKGQTELAVGCDDGKSLGEKVGSEIGMFVGSSNGVPVGDLEILGLSVGDMVGLEDTAGEKVGTTLDSSSVCQAAHYYRKRNSHCGTSTP
jgi:hypothetical protein